MDNVYIHPTANVSKQAIIGDGTKIWINSQIREKSEIGTNCMIAAGSVGTKDIEPFSLVMGNPAKHYSYIDKIGNKI